MINKFNFYDVYGYLIPGLVVLTLLWLPYGMLTGKWPSDAKLVTALLAIPLAYVTGHLLRSLEVFRSTVKDSKGNSRYPNDVLLDADDTNFSYEFKELLAAKIWEKFHIEVAAEQSPLVARADVAGRRKDAFFLCRSALIEGKSASYGEQFEGMYSLARGLAAAFLMSASHYAGCALSGLPYDLGFVADGVLIAGLLAAILTSFLARRTVFYCVLAVLLASGYLVASSQPAQYSWGWFAVMSLAAGLGARLSYVAFAAFAWEFAKAIYRDFYTYEPKKSESKPEGE